jgi:hypothetical protein
MDKTMEQMDRLSINTRFILMIGILYSTGMSVASTFVNIFFMRATGNNLTIIILQNGLNFLP